MMTAEVQTLSWAAPIIVRRMRELTRQAIKAARKPWPEGDGVRLPRQRLELVR